MKTGNRCRAVKWASSVGVVNGYSGTSLFGPNDNVTREQLAVMLANYSTNVSGKPAAGSKDSYASMSDASQVSNWAESAIGWCFDNHIMSGSNNMIRPQGNASRAENAAMVINAYDLLKTE